MRFACIDSLEEPVAERRSLEPQSFAEFERETERGNVIAVVRTLPIGRVTPVDAYERLAKDARYSFLLESALGNEGHGRYSFLGANPSMIVRGKENKTFIERDDGSSETSELRFPEFLRNHFSIRKLAQREGLTPFSAGAVGYLGYSAARWFEPALDAGPADSESPDGIMMFFRTIIIFDSARHTIQITAVVFTEEAGSSRTRLRELYENAVDQCTRLENLLSEVVAVTGSLNPKSKRIRTEVISNWPRDDFHEAVRTVQECIRAGDCYQAVLSQRFDKQVSATPLSIYRALRASNPSPYMYCMQLHGEWIIGASPETLVRCRERRLDYRPIAGTRPRGRTVKEDEAFSRDMRADEKEVAEHMMLVDLGRNDLGRVAEYGSVEVAELMSVERYSHVQHLVTTLRAKLRNGCDRFDALAACFPAGTVTGAPKVSAMEIIRELEPHTRGVYAGAILYADYADNLDSCIAIRTIVLRDGVASVQAGAGIVADSIPEREYEETVNKARALFNAIEMAENGIEGK